jgi:hypothetical protein
VRKGWVWGPDGDENSQDSPLSETKTPMFNNSPLTRYLPDAASCNSGPRFQEQEAVYGVL